MAMPHRVRFLLNYDSDKRHSDHLAVTAMPQYSLHEVHDLDHDASTATHSHQTIAVALVATILDRNLVPYAVTGGMNFYLRGSKRMSGPITIAVNPDGRSKREFLDLFATQPNIIRASDAMLRDIKSHNVVSVIYVDIQGQLVRIELQPRGEAADLIRTHPAACIEPVSLSTKAAVFDCSLLKVAPLVAFTLESHFVTKAAGDYRNLVFVCKSPTWASQVRQAAMGAALPQKWRDCFLNKVLKRDPNDEIQIRSSLDMWPNVLLPAAAAGGQALQVTYGVGGGYGGEVVLKRNRNAPRDGDKTKDGYWTYSGKHHVWYHKHQDGRYSLEGMCL